MKFFTADPHFQHEGIINMMSRIDPQTNRRFTTIERHDEYLIEEINRLVKPTDRLYIIGDASWHDPKSILERINCKNIHLIIGNHDSGSSVRRFPWVYDKLEVKIETGEKVYLDHYPCAYWPSSHRGSYHLYGHVHGEREKILDRCFPGRRSMDVGVDNIKRLFGYYRPISEKEVHGLLSIQPGHDHVSYYQQQQDMRDEEYEARRSREAGSESMEGSKAAV